MKSFITLLFISGLFVSCSHAEFEPVLSQEYLGNYSKEVIIQPNDSLASKESLKMIKQREAVMVLIKYLRLDGTRYVLDVTEREANDMGVIPEIYKCLVEQLERENDAIAEAVSKGENVKLSDPQIQIKKYNDEQLRRSSKAFKIASNSQYSLSGRITTLGQEQGTASFTTTKATTSVTFRCGNTGGALVASHICSVSAFGVKNTETKWNTPFCTAVIEIPVAGSGSGIIAKLTYQTSCPGGGYCVWLSN